jgi:tetratricopeptide (TPR) repeat protein
MPAAELSAGLMRSGRQAMSQGKLDRAISMFRRVRDVYPEAPERSEAMLLLAQALQARGDTVLALAEYRRVATEFPSAPQSVLARSKISEIERQSGLPLSNSPLPVGSYIPADRIEALDERELVRLQQSGINTVVVEIARQGAGQQRSGRSDAGVYFKTDWAPIIRDRLSDVVLSAHRKQVQVWAALSIRRMDWIEPGLGWFDGRYNPATGDVIASGTIDLLHPAVSEYLIGLLMDLAATGVDALLLIADPPSSVWDGFSPFALRVYERDMGQRLDPARLRLGGSQENLHFAPEFWRWAGWKQREQFKVVDAILRAVRKSYPKVRVAIEIHPEALTNPRAALAWYAEDLLDLRRYRFDYIVTSFAPALESATKSLTNGMNGKRLLLLVDPALSRRTLTGVPSGTGLIYKEKLNVNGLTKRGR